MLETGITAILMIMEYAVSNIGFAIFTLLVIIFAILTMK